MLLSLLVFIQRGAMLESGLTVARFFSTNYDSLLRIATNEIASFWIHQITSDGFFSCKMKAGQNAGFRVTGMLKCCEIKKAFRYYIKQIDSMLPCVWFSNRSQKTSKCGKNISDTLGYASCATYLFLPHFDVICDLLLNRRTATWNLFVNLSALFKSNSCLRLRANSNQFSRLCYMWQKRHWLLRKREGMRDRKLVRSRQRSLSSCFILPCCERPLLAGEFSCSLQYNLELAFRQVLV